MDKIFKPSWWEVQIIDKGISLWNVKSGSFLFAKKNEDTIKLASKCKTLHKIVPSSFSKILKPIRKVENLDTSQELDSLFLAEDFIRFEKSK